MTASIKEALAAARQFVEHAPGSNAKATLAKIDAALASLSCGEARERIALAEMVFKSVKFADMTAGDGIFFDDLDPAEFLSDYVTAIDGDCWDGVAEVARDAILATGCVPGEAEPTPTMLLAGARSIGLSTYTDNHIQRAKECWNTMWDARSGIEQPRPSDLVTSARPNEAAIRADERERCAKIADCIADEYGATSFTSTNADQVAALHSKEYAAHEIAAAIRAGRKS